MRATFKSYVDIRSQAKLCDQVITAWNVLLKCRGHQFSKNAWVYILRLILAMTDSVLSPEEETNGPLVLSAPDVGRNQQA